MPANHTVSGMRQPGPGRSVPSFDGTLVFDEASRAAATDDFGHIVNRAPAAVLRPASTADVVAAVRWASRRGWRIAAQFREIMLYVLVARCGEPGCPWA
jgi:FAD/FMN-containing dehydrogenase